MLTQMKIKFYSQVIAYRRYCVALAFLQEVLVLYQIFTNKLCPCTQQAEPTSAFGRVTGTAVNLALRQQKADKHFDFGGGLKPLSIHFPIIAVSALSSVFTCIRC